MGASAGGHLAALLGTLPDGPVALEGQRAPAPASPADAASARVQAVIDFYGPSDLAELSELRPKAGEAVALFLGGAPRDVPDRYASASPVRHVTGDDPAMLLIHGDGDLLVPLDQSRRLASALDAAGVPHRLIVVPGARHGFDLQVGSRDLLPEILAFLESAWNVKSGTSDR
jgi:acetyl esterase/lipase